MTDEELKKYVDDRLPWIVGADSYKCTLNVIVQMIKDKKLFINKEDI